VQAEANQAFAMACSAVFPLAMTIMAFLWLALGRITGDSDMEWAVVMVPIWLVMVCIICCACCTISFTSARTRGVAEIDEEVLDEILTKVGDGTI